MFHLKFTPPLSNYIWYVEAVGMFLKILPFLKGGGSTQNTPLGL